MNILGIQIYQISRRRRIIEKLGDDLIRRNQRFKKCLFTTTTTRKNRETSHEEEGNQHPRIIASIDGGLKGGPAEPLPPDTKTQVTSALRQISLVIKSILYTGLGLGVTATIGFFGLHLWVEYFELRPSQIDNDDGGDGDDTNSKIDDHSNCYGWNEEFEGWGLGYLGKGTDPRLGWKIRSLIRAAWVAENWQTGRLALGFQESNQVPDGRLIDSGYAISESRLQQAILMIKELDSNPHQSSSSSLFDRSLIELQLRLASVCERINTNSSLAKSYEIHSQIWRSCSNQLSNDSNHNRETSKDWKLHQAIRSALHLSQIGLKISDLERSINPIRAHHLQSTSRRFLIWAIGQTLGIQSIPDPENLDSIHSRLDPQKTESSQSSSWFNLFGQIPRKIKTFKKNSAPLVLGNHHSLDLVLEPIERQIKDLSMTTITTTTDGDRTSFSSNDLPSPIMTRLMISSLLKLSVDLASMDLNRAFKLQKMIQELMNSMIKIEENRSRKLGTPDSQLQYYWLKSREAISLVYLSEIGHVTKNLSDLEVINHCRNGLKIVDNALSNLKQEDQQQKGSKVFSVGLTHASSGRLSDSFKNLNRDIRLTGSMISNFLALKYEVCPSKKSFLQLLKNSNFNSKVKIKKNLDWCYQFQDFDDVDVDKDKDDDDDDDDDDDRYRLSKKFFRLAVGYSLGNSKDPSDHQDLVLLEPLNENLNHLSRLKSLSTGDR